MSADIVIIISPPRVNSGGGHDPSPVVTIHGLQQHASIQAVLDALDQAKQTYLLNFYGVSR